MQQQLLVLSVNKMQRTNNEEEDGWLNAV